MSNSGKRVGLVSAAAISAAMLLSGAGHAADLGGPDSLKDAPDAMSDAHGGNAHATIPAGVNGAAMVGQGEGMAMYMPMVMGMDGNYIGTGKVSTATLLKTINTMKSGMGAGMPLRMVPDSMTGQMQMLGVMYGVTDAVNVMVMGGYTEKDMTMTTYQSAAMAGARKPIRPKALATLR